MGESQLKGQKSKGLTRGCCRLCSRGVAGVLPPSDDTSTNSTASVPKKSNPPFRSSQPVFIIDEKKEIYLCQHVLHSNFPSFQERVLMCYDNSARIVPWGGTGGTNDVVNKIRPFFATQINSISPLTPDAVRRFCIEREESHCHAALSLSKTIDPKLMQTNQPNFIVAASEYPTILLSISLRARISCENHGVLQPLLHSRLKRQMVGMVIAFMNQSITTDISFVFGEERLSKYYVDSIVPDRKQSRGGLVYIVLPSTRITLLEPVKEDALTSAGETKLDNIADKSVISPVAQILIDTAKLLRNRSRVGASRTFILSGPPGVGKTFSIKTAYQACQKEGPTVLLSLGSMLGSASNPSEASRALEKHFIKAARACDEDIDRVAMIFIDECDALLSSDIIAGMCASLLDRTSDLQGGWQRLMVIAATNRIDSIPSYLRRPGRFDKEIPISPPTAEDRFVILSSLLSNNATTSNGPPSLDSQFISDLADACVGYVPADLSALVRRAALIAIEEGHASIQPDTLQRALSDTGASALRDTSLSAPPKMSWDDVAGDPGGAKTALRQAIEWPRVKKAAFKSLGLIPPKGILLYGPPGCAKTTLARAAAGASGAAFVSLSPADVYASSYVGEAESIVRKAFTLARSAAPCVLFFDEIDSILGSEGPGDGGGGAHGMNRSGRGSSAEARVLSTFLNEMDGVDGSSEDGVLVLGATNRPWTLDAALLRAQRFDKVIYVPPPDYEGRLSILNMYCQSWNAPDIDVEYLASKAMSGSMTGAEIVGACRTAALEALRHAQTNGGSLHSSNDTIEIKQEYLEEQLKTTQPLLSNPGVLEDFIKFENSRRRF